MAAVMPPEDHRLMWSQVFHQAACQVPTCRFFAEGVEDRLDVLRLEEKHQQECRERDASS